MFIVEDHTVTMKCRTAKKAATLLEFVSMFCDCEMENSNKSSDPQLEFVSKSCDGEIQKSNTNVVPLLCV